MKKQPEFKRRTIVRHLETKAFEGYSAVWINDSQQIFAMMARTTPELEIIWNMVTNLPLDFNKVQKVLMIGYQDKDGQNGNFEGN